MQKHKYFCRSLYKRLLPWKVVSLGNKNWYLIIIHYSSSGFDLDSVYTPNRKSVREQGRHEAAGLKKWWFFKINYIFHLSKFWDVRIRSEIVFLLFQILAVYYDSAFLPSRNLAFNGGDLVDSEWQTLACHFHVPLAGLTFTCLILISKN